MFEINNRWTVDGSVRSTSAAIANRSCRPNAESALRGHSDARHQGIEAGEEITYDYGDEYFGCSSSRTAAAAKMRGNTKARRAKKRDA
jgi:hypothetical protein